jgi:hypothetical protein
MPTQYPQQEEQKKQTGQAPSQGFSLWNIWSAITSGISKAGQAVQQAGQGIKQVAQQWADIAVKVNKALEQKQLKYPELDHGEVMKLVENSQRASQDMGVPYDVAENKLYDMTVKKKQDQIIRDQEVAKRREITAMKYWPMKDQLTPEMQKSIDTSTKLFQVADKMRELGQYNGKDLSTRSDKDLIASVQDHPEFDNYMRWVNNAFMDDLTKQTEEVKQTAVQKQQEEQQKQQEEQAVAAQPGGVENQPLAYDAVRKAFYEKNGRKLNEQDPKDQQAFKDLYKNIRQDPWYQEQLQKKGWFTPKQSPITMTAEMVWQGVNRIGAWVSALTEKIPWVKDLNQSIMQAIKGKWYDIDTHRAELAQEHPEIFWQRQKSENETAAQNAADIGLWGFQASIGASSPVATTVFNAIANTDAWGYIFNGIAKGAKGINDIQIGMKEDGTPKTVRDIPGWNLLTPEQQDEVSNLAVQYVATKGIEKLPSVAPKVIEWVWKWMGRVYDATLWKRTSTEPKVKGQVWFSDRLIAATNDLDPSTVRKFRDNPEMVKEIEAGNLSKETIKNDLMWIAQGEKWATKEVGKAYQGMYSSNTRFDPMEILNDTTKSLKDKWVVFDEKWNIKWFDTTMKNQPSPAEMTAIKKSYNDTKATLLTKWEWELTPEELHNIKINLGKASFVEWVAKFPSQIMKEVSESVNKRLKSIPWRSEVDKMYSEKAKIAQQLHSDIFNNKWEFKDTINSLLWEKKAGKLDRLEQVMPWLREKIEMVKAHDDYVRSRESQKTGASKIVRWAGGIWAGASIGAAFWPIWSAIGWALGAMVSQFFSDPKLFKERVTKNVKWSEGIVEKVESGISLSATEKAKLSEAVQKAQEHSNLPALPQSVEQPIVWELLPWGGVKTKGGIAETYAPGVQEKMGQPNMPDEMWRPMWAKMWHQPFDKVRDDENPMMRKKNTGIGSGMPAKTDLSPLHEEARKYKSADEFVKSKWQPLYHGTSSKREWWFKEPVKWEYGSEAIFLSPDELWAEYYNRWWWEVKRVFLDKWTKIWDYTKKEDLSKVYDFIDNDKWFKKYLDDAWFILPKEEIKSKISKWDYGWIQKPKIMDYLREKWYDWFKNMDWYEWGLSDSIGIFSNKKVKIESQLKKIREEANKTSKTAGTAKSDIPTSKKDWVDIIKEKPYWYEVKNTKQAPSNLDPNKEYEKASSWIWAEIINSIPISEIKKIYDKAIKVSDISERIRAIREIKWSVAYTNAKHIEDKTISNSENFANWKMIFDEKLKAPNYKTSK